LVFISPRDLSEDFSQSKSEFLLFLESTFQRYRSFDASQSTCFGGLLEPFLHTHEPVGSYPWWIDEPVPVERQSDVHGVLRFRDLSTALRARARARSSSSRSSPSYSCSSFPTSFTFASEGGRALLRRGGGGGGDGSKGRSSASRRLARFGEIRHVWSCGGAGCAS